jgi:signal peptidase I
MDAAKTTRHPPNWLVRAAIGRRPWLTVARLAVLIISTWAVFSFVLTPPVRVTGISMLPTYHNGQINFINRLAYLRHDPQRGDVVGVHFKHTAGDSVLYLKRIVGLPGETVSFADGKLYINGEPQDEPYVKTPCNWDMPSMKLGLDEYYLVGDNRGMAFADHEQGAARRQQIVGRILFRGSS